MSGFRDAWARQVTPSLQPPGLGGGVWIGDNGGFDESRERCPYCEAPMLVSRTLHSRRIAYPLGPLEPDGRPVRVSVSDSHRLYLCRPCVSAVTLPEATV